MDLKRVLYIMSVIDDEDPASEEKYLQEKLYSKGIEIRLYYPVRGKTNWKDFGFNYIDSSNSRLHEEYLEKVFENNISYKKLVDELANEIDNFHPDILLLHTGIAFRNRPEAFLQALAVIKDRYPRIELRYERYRHGDGPYVTWEGTTKIIYTRTLLDKNDLFHGDQGDLLA